MNMLISKILSLCAAKRHSHSSVMQPIQEIGGVEKPCKALAGAFASKRGFDRPAVG
ncbi:hypothetical protein [Hoeflea sp.]|uniref:hypothetical protein n=1 Tax=Hoeflea sp. TaxID=1940281 RepID=UPI00199C3DEE|nr:hypothetical protein [Hoeflea sp.]MBC7282701.1 hypothetical protein [Hoeflea sp.]